MDSRRAPRRAVLGTVVAAVLIFSGIQPATAEEPPSGDVSGITAERVQGSSATADALSVTAPAEARSGGAQLNAADAGSLTGSVQSPDAEPVPGVLVSAYRLNTDGGLDRVETVQTDAVGAYSFSALPVGGYDLFFNPPHEAPWMSVAWSWRGGGPYPDLSGPVAVASGESADAGIQVLGRGSSIGGIVKSESGLRPLTGVRAVLWGSNGVGDDGMLDFGSMFEASTEGGIYAFDQVPNGYDLLRYESVAPQYASEWWRNKASFASSDIIPVTSASAYTINANLASKVNLGDVTVSGASATGATLTAKHRVSAGTAYKYGWFADGAAIPGATKSTFVPTAAQQHKRITVRVTGTKTGVVTTTKSSAPRAKTLLTAVPTISGNASITNAVGPDTSFWKGSTLTAKPGTWTAGAALTYQWYADGKAIAGASGRTYTLKPADRGKRFSVKVTGSLADYGTFGRSSSQTPRVAVLGTVFLDPNPTAAASGPFGSFVTAGGASGPWQPGTTFAYHFYANGALVQSGASPRLEGVSRFIGKRLQVRMVVSNPGYSTFTLWSNTTNPVRG